MGMLLGFCYAFQDRMQGNNSPAMAHNQASIRLLPLKDILKEDIHRADIPKGATRNQVDIQVRPNRVSNRLLMETHMRGPTKVKHFRLILTPHMMVRLVLFQY